MIRGQLTYELESGHREAFEQYTDLESRSFHDFNVLSMPCVLTHAQACMQKPTHMLSVSMSISAEMTSRCCVVIQDAHTQGCV